MSKENITHFVTTNNGYTFVGTMKEFNPIYKDVSFGDEKRCLQICEKRIANKKLYQTFKPF